MYLVVNDFGQFGRAFVETDVAEADRETIIRNFITGQYSDAIRVVAAQSAVGRPCTNFDGKSNPFGRPRGLRNRATVAAEAMLDGEAQELTRKVIELGEKRQSGRAPAMYRPNCAASVSLNCALNMVGRPVRDTCEAEWFR